MVLGEQQFGGDNIFPHFTDILPGEGGGLNGDFMVGGRLHLLDHDDGVAAFGDDIPGVYGDRIRAHGQRNRTGLGGPESACGPDGHAIHGGDVKSG